MEWIVPMDIGNGFWSLLCWKMRNKKTGMEGIVPMDIGNGFRSLLCWKMRNKKNRDGGDRTPGYGSEDRRVAITPHPYLYLTKIFIIQFSSVANTSFFHNVGISGLVSMNLIKSCLMFCTSLYLLIFNHFSIGS